MDSSVHDSPPKVPFDTTPRTLGCYELLLPLGSGGMATVWSARRKGTRGFQKIVAVKVMHDRLRQSGTHERMFLDEARIAARIKHPHVVEIYDLGDQDGVLYQVMEWVDGEPLFALLNACQGRLPIPIAVQIAIQIAAGLHAAHQARDEDGAPLRLVHRDVSPQNILIGFDGTVKVTDFGVAKAASNTALTAVGQLKGKLAYMSPEQVSGHPIDRRTDIFVLGVLLYLMTTGRHPFRCDTDVATLRRILDGSPPVAPEEIIPGYPRALSEIVLQTLHRDPFERCASMADLMRALETALPLEERLSAEDLGAFMRSRLGEARARRRAALRSSLAVRGETLPSQSSSPSLPRLSPTPPSPGSEQPGAASSSAVVVSAAAREASWNGRRTRQAILLALAIGALGCAAGFAGARLSTLLPPSNGAVPSDPPVCHPRRE